MKEYIVMNGIKELGLIITSSPNLAEKAANNKYSEWTHMTRGTHMIIQNQKR